MREPRQVSIKRKLTSIIMLTSTVTLVLVCGAILAYELSTFREHTESDLTTLADIIGDHCAAALIGQDRDAAQRTLESLGDNRHVVSACIYTKEGEVFADYNRNTADWTPPVVGADGSVFLRDFALLFRPIVLDGKRIGTVHLRSDLDVMYARLERYSLIICAILFVSIAFAYLLSYGLQRVISNPILELAETAKKVSVHKNYSVRVEDTRRNKAPDELDTLITVFNGMLGQIQRRDLKLRRAHDELEQRVEERTGELRQEIVVRKATEEELKEARDAALEASRIKSEFLANMSHEIRTPMNGIIGMTELALKMQLDEELRDYLGMVSESADSLLTIINDILDFSKIEAGKLELDASRFRLREGIRDILGPLGIRAQEKGLELDFDIADDVPDALVGDPGRLRQVIINLVGNAVKFTDLGRVAVRVANERFTDEEATLRFSVSDTGIGIPEEKKERIFEAFTQVDGSSTRRFGGTGLGLTISTQLVELMGGAIWVESEVGKGSTFHFTAQFGVSGADPAGEEFARGGSRFAARNAPQVARPLRILLAEDNPVNQKLAIRILEGDGHSVAVANNGREAMEAFERESFDIILMDVQMSEMGGFEATRLIREKEKETGTHVPIVAVTAHAMKGDRELCLEAGMDEYITKPIESEKLVEVVANLVPADAEQESATASGNRPESAPPPLNITRETFLEHLGGDEELLLDIAPIFLDTCPELMAEISRAVAARDANALKEAAHSLKGSVGNFGVPEAADAAFRLEMMGREENFDGAVEAMQHLEDVIGRVMAVLKTLDTADVA